jgi:hypothetical protein
MLRINSLCGVFELEDPDEEDHPCLLGDTLGKSSRGSSTLSSELGDTTVSNGRRLESVSVVVSVVEESLEI